MTTDARQLSTYEAWMVRSNLKAIAAGVTTGADNVATLHANGYHRVAAAVAAAVADPDFGQPAAPNGEPYIPDLEQPNPLEEYGASRRADSIAGNHAEEEAQRLELEEMQRAELEEERRPTVAEIIGADLEQRAAMVAELEELRAIRAELERIARFDSVATTLYKARGRAIAKRDRLASTRTMQQSNAELAAGGEAEELNQALEFIRKHNPLRRALVEQFTPKA